jgi:hypothetical protein
VGLGLGLPPSLILSPSYPRRASLLLRLQMLRLAQHDLRFVNQVRRMASRMHGK